MRDGESSVRNQKADVFTPSHGPSSGQSSEIAMIEILYCGVIPTGVLSLHAGSFHTAKTAASYCLCAFHRSLYDRYCHCYTPIRQITI